MFSLICAWTNSWASTRDCGDLRRHRAHYDVIVMPVYILCFFCLTTGILDIPRHPGLITANYADAFPSCTQICSSYFLYIKREQSNHRASPNFVSQFVFNVRYSLWFDASILKSHHRANRLEKCTKRKTIMKRVFQSHNRPSLTVVRHSIKMTPSTPLLPVANDNFSWQHQSL